MTADVDLEDELLNVQMARLADPVTWLPAIEQFGEGIFLQFDPAVLLAWKANPKVQERAGRLEAGHKLWTDHRYAGKKAPAFPRSRLLPRPLALARSDVRDRHGMRLSAKRSQGAHIPFPDRPWPADLHGGRRRRRHPRRPSRACAAPRRIYPARARTRRPLFKHPTCSDHDPALKEDDRHLQGAAAMAACSHPKPVANPATTTWIGRFSSNT